MSERFEMRLDEEKIKRIDGWRSQQTDVPSRAEAMRRLVELGLIRSSGETVRLSNGEKLLAMMMYDIYKHFKIEGEINPDLIGEVVWGGHYWALGWELTGLFHNYEDDPRDVSFVVNVLDMWSFIERAYEKLTRKEKERVEREASPFGKDVQFPGFDGNDESSHLGITRFLIEKMNRFSQFKGRDLNSHMPTIDTYQRMLAEFLPMREGLSGTNLNANQIIQILKCWMKATV